MGIDISHSLLVGCSYNELEEFIQRKIDEDDNEEYPLDEQGVIEEYFESASPYYGADRERCFFGLPLSNFTEPNQAWFEELDKACVRFEELTGIKAKIRGGANVW